MTRLTTRLFLIGIMMAAAATNSVGQTSASPLYAGSFGGGLAMTGGNTDTKNFNLIFNVVRDPKTKNLIKANAAYLRGTQNKLLNLDRTAVGLRDEYTVSKRVFVFGQTEYLRDKFKEIIFLWAPVGGVGFRMIDTDETKLGVDVGSGGVFEKNPGIKTSKSASINLGQNFQHKISSTATLSQSWSTIWKTNDFEDSLTNLSLALTTSIARRLELKLEFIDSYKNKPASATIKKNDTAFLTTFVVKF